MPRHVAVDPLFPQRLRELRQQRRLTLRALAAQAHQGKSYIHELETGQKQPTVEVARQLDAALGAVGGLARMVTSAVDGLWTPDDDERLLYVARNPRRIDTATLDSLSVVLDHQRRLEDSIGSAPLAAPVVAQVALLERLVDEAPDDDRRPRLLDVASQWAQFAAWLATTTGDHTTGRDRYLRAMEWATEAGNPDMVATALSMRGHLAWIRGRYRPMIELSRAAGWQPASPGVRALAVQQEGRGLALIGDAAGSDSRMDEAEDLAALAGEHRDQEPPWLYFYDDDYLRLQRGLAHVYLGRYDRAVEMLGASLDRLSPEIRRADWVGWYVLQLARALHALGEIDESRSSLEEARRIAVTTGATRLRREVEELARQLGE